MTALSAARSAPPEPDDHAPYFGRYVSLVPEGDVLQTLDDQARTTLSMLRDIGEDKASYRYTPDKWSIRQVVGHMADTERVFAYRALRFARNDASPLSGFDENAFVANARFDACTLAALCDNFAAVRASTLSLLSLLDGDEWGRRGISNGKEMSVRGAAWIIAGHELHHVNLLRTRYL